MDSSVAVEPDIDGRLACVDGMSLEQVAKAGRPELSRVVEGLLGHLGPDGEDQVAAFANYI